MLPNNFSHYISFVKLNIHLTKLLFVIESVSDTPESQLICRDCKSMLIERTIAYIKYSKYLYDSRDIMFHAFDT